MKNLTKFFSALALFAIFFSSCSKQETNELLTKNGEEKTETQLIEEETGISLEKIIETISDDRGNTVDLLIASTDMTIIENYLENTDISLQIEVEDSQNTDDLENQSSQITNNPNEVSDLNFEIVGTSFGEEVITYKLNFSSKSEVETGSNIDSRYGYTTSLTSGKWIEGFKISYYSYLCGDDCDPEIYVEHLFGIVDKIKIND